jgi:hypothetical protein
MDEVLEAMLLPPRPNGFAEDLPLFEEQTRGPADRPRPDDEAPAR